MTHAPLGNHGLPRKGRKYPLPVPPRPPARTLDNPPPPVHLATKNPSFVDEKPRSGTHGEKEPGFPPLIWGFFVPYEEHVVCYGLVTSRTRRCYNEDMGTRQSGSLCSNVHQSPIQIAIVVCHNSHIAATAMQCTLLVHMCVFGKATKMLNVAVPTVIFF